MLCQREPSIPRSRLLTFRLCFHILSGWFLKNFAWILKFCLLFFKNKDNIMDSGAQRNPFFFKKLEIQIQKKKINHQKTPKKLKLEILSTKPHFFHFPGIDLVCYKMRSSNFYMVCRERYLVFYKIYRSGSKFSLEWMSILLIKLHYEHFNKMDYIILHIDLHSSFFTCAQSSIIFKNVQKSVQKNLDIENRRFKNCAYFRLALISFLVICTSWKIWKEREINKKNVLLSQYQITVDENLSYWSIAIQLRRKRMAKAPFV